MRLHDKYLTDGDVLLGIGDLPQASEKFWGGVSQMIKAVAATRRVRHTNHGALRDVIRTLYRETSDGDFVALMRSAERLHTNFYENDLNEQAVRALASDCRRLIQMLVPLSGGST